jgi:Zn-dependent peptidase ImmA (M78 family)
VGVAITLRYTNNLPVTPFWRDIERLALADRRALGCRFGEPCEPKSLQALYDVYRILDDYQSYEHHFGRSMVGKFAGLERWSGVTLYTKGGEHLIMLNPEHPATRSKLSLAHEFGHLAFAHRPILVGLEGQMPKTRYSDQQEREAYGYGVALLLPYAPLFQMINQRASTRGIAHHYGVSVQAVEMRLKVTGLWGLRP